MIPSLQWLRHAVQLLVIAFMLLTPCLMHYRVLLESNRIESVRMQEDKTLADQIVIFLDNRFRGSSVKDLEDSTMNREAALAALGKVQGNHWSARLFGVSLTDPLAAAESFYATGTFTVTLLMGMLIPVLATMLLGRVFCSWICPAGLLFEVGDQLRRLLHRFHAGHSLTFWRGNKHVLLLVGLAMSAVIGLPLLGYLYPPAIVGRESHRLVDFLMTGATVGGVALTAASVLLLGVVLFEVFVSRRAWCRYFCPGGALYSVLGVRRVVRLRNDTDVCTQCSDCVSACPMGLNPMKNKFGGECDLCLECRSACGSRSLKLTLAFGDARNEATAAKQH